MPDLHPDLTPDVRRRLLVAGVELFQAGRYFDCHEAFEEVWRSTTPEPKNLWQGLIQVAVGLYHFERGKPRVARRVLAKGRRRLEPFPAVILGLDLARLLDGEGGVRSWERWIDEGCLAPPPRSPRLMLVDPGALS